MSNTECSLQISKFRKKLTDKQADLRAKKRTHDGLLELEKQLEINLKAEQEAAEIIKAAAETTQKQFQANISSVVTYGLASVFEDPYKFVAVFTPRRGTIECDLRFERKGKRIRPLKAGGYGAADIASLTLRFAFRNMSSTRPIIIVDEPARQLSVDYHDQAAKMIKELTDNLGLQLIMVTHRRKLLTVCDKNFNVKLVNGNSKVTEE